VLNISDVLIHIFPSNLLYTKNKLNSEKLQLTCRMLEDFFFSLRRWQKLQQSESGFIQALLLPAPYRTFVLVLSNEWFRATLLEQIPTDNNPNLDVFSNSHTCRNVFDSLPLPLCLSEFALELSLSWTQPPKPFFFLLNTLIDLSF